MYFHTPPFPNFPSSTCYLLCTCLSDASYMLGRCFGPLDRCFGLLVRCLTGCFTSSCQLSDKEHQANNKCLTETAMIYWYLFNMAFRLNCPTCHRSTYYSQGYLKRGILEMMDTGQGCPLHEHEYTFVSP